MPGRWQYTDRAASLHSRVASILNDDLSRSFPSATDSVPCFLTDPGFWEESFGFVIWLTAWRIILRGSLEHLGCQRRPAASEQSALNAFTALLPRLVAHFIIRRSHGAGRDSPTSLVALRDPSAWTAAG